MQEGSTLTIIQQKKKLGGDFAMLVLGRQIGLLVALVSCARKSFVQTQMMDSAIGSPMFALIVFAS